MHPNAQFRRDDRALLRAIVDEVGFGMVFAATPDGPRVAHVPLVLAKNGADDVLRFHIARGNALARHLDGLNALAVVNGPDGYVSPRWLADPAQVPTWNYVALELEGKARRIDQDSLLALLEAQTARNEARVTGGEPWTMAKMPADKLRTMMAAIVGFEIEVTAWRETFKLSQNKPADERARAIAGLEEQGAPAMAALMRGLVS